MKSDNIQGLRAFAAYAVVVHHVIHALYPYLAVDHAHPGPAMAATGVDIFFVVSGFVMALSVSAKPVGPLVFLTHRIARIVPMYWLVTMLAIFLAVGPKLLAGDIGTDLRHLLTSLFFLPDFDANQVQRNPIVFPGWTLNYEMMFYTAFAAWLLVRNATIRLAGIIASILAVWLLQVFFPSPLLKYLGNDIILAFAFGVFLWPLSRRYRFPPLIAFAVIPCALVMLASIDMPFLHGLPHSRVIVSLGAALLVFSALSLDKAGITIGRGWLARQGDASYSLYLIHVFVIAGLAQASLGMHLTRSSAGLVVTAVAMFACCGVVGTLLHRYVENPINRIFRGRSIGATVAQHAAAVPTEKASALPVN
jgi:exopolysaccharide production protein ExoZ